MTKKKVLIWDLETAGYGNYRGPAADWGYTLCFGYKWLGEKKAHVLKLSDYSLWDKNCQDDTALIKDAYKIMLEADELVAHYGDKFDKPWFQTRLLKAGLGIIPPIKQIDTCKIAQKYLKLSSNRLDNITKFFGLHQKQEKEWTGWWLRTMRGDNKALKDMAKYCINDVLALEAVYLKLLPLIPVKTSARLFTNNPKSCPRCGEDKLHKNGYVNRTTGKYQRYMCSGCGGWSRDADAVKLENGLKRTEYTSTEG